MADDRSTEDASPRVSGREVSPGFAELLNEREKIGSRKVTEPVREIRACEKHHAFW